MIALAQRCGSCGATEVHARGLCNGCYVTWRRQDRRERGLSPRADCSKTLGEARPVFNIPTVRVTPQALRAYQEWGVRCATLEEFARWYGVAVAVGTAWPATFDAYCADAGSRGTSPKSAWCVAAALAGRCSRLGRAT